MRKNTHKLSSRDSGLIKIVSIICSEAGIQVYDELLTTNIDAKKRERGLKYIFRSKIYLYNNFS